ESPLDRSRDPTTAAAAEPAAVNPPASGSVASVITSKTIAWISYRTGWTELYKTDPLGIQSTPLTALKTTLQGVSWSWDNNRLATVRYRAIDLYHGHNDI